MIIDIRVASCYLKALFVILGDYNDSSITHSGVRVDLLHAKLFLSGRTMALAMK